MPERPIQLSNSETESDRLSATRPLKLIIAQVTNSSEDKKKAWT